MQARHLVAGDVVHAARVTSLTARSVVRVYLGGMTLAVPGATGFVALAQRAVAGMIGKAASGLPLSRRNHAALELELRDVAARGASRR